MRPETELVRRHLRALEEEAREQNVNEDLLGRLILQEAIELWRRARSVGDIQNELCFFADSLDPDTDFEFMRP